MIRHEGRTQMQKKALFLSAVCEPLWYLPCFKRAKLILPSVIIIIVVVVVSQLRSFSSVTMLQALLGLVTWTCFLSAATAALSFALWFKFADADLTLLLKSKLGRPLGVLEGKVIWITGASSGIGEYLAYEMARVKARLVLSGTNHDGLLVVGDACKALGCGDVLLVPFDVSDYGCHEQILRVVLDRYGKVDVLVNNAGRSQRAAFGEVCTRTDLEMFAINVFGPLSLTRLVLHHFEQSGHRGHVVVTSSVAGKLGAPFSATYTATKHALHGYFECLRTESSLAGGVDVTLVCPGPVRSRVRERAFTAVPGRTYGLKDGPQSKLMLTKRCAQLMAVAIANKMDEAWICENPILLLLYVSQYAPSLFRSVLVKILFTKERVSRLREGH